MSRTHGRSGTLTYARWVAMIARCHRSSASNYKDYGAKGITVCDRWRHSFEAFLADVGECPGPKMTLDRRRNAIGYEPGNCRWATRTEQNRNRSNCRSLTHAGQTKTLSVWAEDLGISPSTLRLRLKHGWSLERALTPTLGGAKLPRHGQPPPVRGELLTFDGRTQPITAWAVELRLTAGALRKRLRQGWALDRALGSLKRGAKGQR